MNFKIAAQNLIAVAIVATGPVAPCRAADYWVSSSGNDEAAGAQSAPWQTIQRAMNTLKPGDTAHVTAGTYREKVRIQVSGVAKAPLTLKAEGAVILSGKGVEGQNLISIQNQSHIRIVGLELRDNLQVKDGSGIRVEGACAGIEIRGCRIHEIRGRDAMGITVYGTSSEAPITGLIIDGNEIYDCDPAKSEALTLNGNVSSFQVTNNVVHDVNNIGIDFIGGEAWVANDPGKVARDGVCSGNTVYRCRSSYGGGYAAGIYVDGGRNIVIQNNVVTQCDLGIEIGAENRGSAATGITVRRNTVYFNDKAGIVFGGYEKGAGRVRDSEFSGNVCWHNDRHKDQNGELWIQWAEGNTVTGNVFVSGEESPLVMVEKGAGANAIDGNHYYSEAGVEDAYFIWHEEDVNGFGEWQRTSRWDAGSVFGPVKADLPAVPKR